jgi:hypothetical protein
MAYTIFQLARSEGERAMITFTSKTRVGLNEEIDRFIMEEMPLSLFTITDGGAPAMFPSYSIVGRDLEAPWCVRMIAFGMGHPATVEPEGAIVKD